jgi:hypothetical protein
VGWFSSNHRKSLQKDYPPQLVARQNDPKAGFQPEHL